MASARFRPSKGVSRVPRPTPAGSRFSNLGRSILMAVIVILTVLSLMFLLLDLKVRPVVVVAARALATRAATEALNQAVTEEIAHDVDYDRMVEIDKGPDGRTQVARFNFASVTELQAAATARAQDNLRALSLDAIQLPLGQALAGPLIGNAGPRLPIHLYLLGTAHSSVTTDVKSVGVNQTVHILYLDLSAQVNVVAPLVTTPITVQARVPIAYVVLAGPVPNTYFNGSGTGLSIIPQTLPPN